MSVLFLPSFGVVFVTLTSLSVDGSKVLINTVVTARMSFTKTSQKFCQWVDTKANQVYGLGFANEIDLTRVEIYLKEILLFKHCF